MKWFKRYGLWKRSANKYALESVEGIAYRAYKRGFKKGREEGIKSYWK